MCWILKILSVDEDPWYQILDLIQDRLLWPWLWLLRHVN